MMVMLVDRVLALLDHPGMSVVVMGAVDWIGEFDRQDPTMTVTKLINMGLRPSQVSVVLEDRKMVVR